MDMNALERRRIAKSHVIDVAVAKVAINKSGRQRAEAAQKKLRKEVAANHFASVVQSETISYPRQAAG